MFNQEFALIDEPKEKPNELQKQIINLLYENKYTISQARGLLKGVINRLERSMPITNETV